MVNKRRKDRIPRHVKRRMCHIGMLKKKKKPWVNLEWKYATGKTIDFVNGTDQSYANVKLGASSRPMINK